MLHPFMLEIVYFNLRGKKGNTGDDDESDEDSQAGQGDFSFLASVNNVKKWWLTGDSKERATLPSKENPAQEATDVTHVVNDCCIHKTVSQVYEKY